MVSDRLVTTAIEKIEAAEESPKLRRLK